MTKAEIILETRNAVEKVLKAQVKNAGVTSYAAAAAHYAKEVRAHAQAKGLSLEKALVEKLKQWANEILPGSDMPRAIKKNLGI